MARSSAAPSDCQRAGRQELAKLTDGSAVHHAGLLALVLRGKCQVEVDGQFADGRSCRSPRGDVHGDKRYRGYRIDMLYTCGDAGRYVG